MVKDTLEKVGLWPIISLLIMLLFGATTFLVRTQHDVDVAQNLIIQEKVNVDQYRFDLNKIFEQLNRIETKIDKRSQP